MKICKHCGYDLPEDSLFCQYCGETVAQAAEEPFHGVHGEVSMSDILQSAISDGKIDNATQVGDIVKKPISTEEKLSQYNLKLIGGILAVIIVLLGVVCGYLLFQNSEIKARNEEVNQLANTYKRQISSLENKLSFYEDKAAWYDEIVRELKGENLGYAASNFHTDSGVYVVSKYNVSEKIKLTAHWSNWGYVNVDYSSNAARVIFDKNTWTTSTTMTIDPNKEGVTVVTFSNTADSKTFKVLIIVT